MRASTFMCLASVNAVTTMPVKVARRRFKAFSANATMNGVPSVFSWRNRKTRGGCVIYAPSSPKCPPLRAFTPEDDDSFFTETGKTIFTFVDPSINPPAVSVAAFGNRRSGFKKTKKKRLSEREKAVKASKVGVPRYRSKVVRRLVDGSAPDPLCLRVVETQNWFHDGVSTDTDGKTTIATREELATATMNTKEGLCQLRNYIDLASSGGNLGTRMKESTTEAHGHFEERGRISLETWLLTFFAGLTSWIWILNVTTTLFDNTCLGGKKDREGDLSDDAEWTKVEAQGIELKKKRASSKELVK